MSLTKFVFQPLSKLLLGNVFFWNTTYRPLAGVLYWTLFHFFGTDPLPYYVTGFIIRLANLGLLFFLLTRITNSPYLAAVTTALSAIHWETSDAIYNFGAVFELLAFCFFLISFHLYLSFVENGRNRKHFYIGSLLAYILALNSKEIAITLPAVIFIYECIYNLPEGNFSKRLRWLLPFVAIGIIYASGKLFGQNTYLEIDAFKYAFDAEVLKNLEKYIEKLFYNWVDLNLVTILLFAFGSLAVAIWIRSKAMLFGWFYFFITLIPIIGLRRFWGLYLYIPIAGITLYGVALFVEIANRLIKKTIPLEAVNAALVLFFCLLLVIQYPRFVSATEKYFIAPGNVKRNFQRQLLAAYPSVPHDTVFGFTNAPLDGYNLHFIVWLSYNDPSLQIFRLPQQQKQFLKVGQNIKTYTFEYRH
jgi:hypothetical protein